MQSLQPFLQKNDAYFWSSQTIVDKNGLASEVEPAYAQKKIEMNANETFFIITLYDSDTNIIQQNSIKIGNASEIIDSSKTILIKKIP